MLSHSGCVKFLALIVCVPIMITNSGDIENNSNRSAEILSRRKRYVTFPEGASFSVAACMTVGVIGNPQAGIFTWGMNWGIAYELPNETMTVGALQRLHKIPKPLVARRFRRDLYSKLEMVMRDMGYNGRECIYRALCEAAQRLLPKGNSIIEELFRTVFSLPLTKIYATEPSEHKLYTRAHRSGFSNIDCHLKYRGCPFSLLDLVLGYHSPPSKNSLKYKY